MTAGSLSAFVLAVAVGAAVGLSELLSRYRWSLGSILSSVAGWGYLMLNGAVAALAYRAALDWGFGTVLQGKPEHWRVLLVAVGAMFLLRSSLAQVRFGSHDVGIGLVTILEVFSRRAERRLDQVIASERWSKVDKACTKLTYRATQAYWSAVSDTALASQSEAERATFRSTVEKIDGMPVDDDTKMRLLAMALWELLGNKLFETVANEASVRFKSEIEADRSARSAQLQQLAALKAELSKPNIGGPQ
jgi:hypothetical protein